MKKWIFNIALFLMATQFVFAQQNSPEKALEEHLFSPELVMANQKAIGLTEDQGEQIMTEAKEAQSDFMDLQWAMSKKSDEFIANMSESAVNEDLTLQKLSEMLELESKIKKGNCS